MTKNYKTAKWLVDLLENRFKVGPWKVGLDPILGLVPGAGDMITTALSIYIIWLAAEMRLPKDKLAKMVRNTILDLAVGALPLVGDVGDFVFRANRRNWKIIEEHFALQKDKEAIEGEIV